MVTFDEIIKKSQQQQQQQQQQQDQKKEEVKQKLFWNTTQKINPAQSLEDSLANAEKHTAFSAWHIKDLASTASDWFSNVWHTITDKDEDHWILDYSEYKRYKDILDAAPKNDTDLTAVYQQMANEWVIDYNKFTSWYETEWAKEQGKYYKYNKAVDAIKVDFDTKLATALQPYMKGDEWSYQINALTKAREVMNNQFSMFLDWYASTYKSTRDSKLLEDFNDTLKEYETSIINFTKQWANNLTSKDEWGNKAYYDTLNDAWMLDYAKNIRRIQFETENKLTSAAMKSNFWDSWTALMNWNPISSMAELLGWAINWVNWVLDKFVWNPTEYAKNATIGWYDVVEELANLNVYSNDAWALQKTFGTMASWMWDILDAAPTLVPAVVDIIVWDKVWVIGKAGKASKRANKIDDAVGVIYKNQKAAKNIAKAWDLMINVGNSGNLWTFPLQMLSRFLENVFVFDVAAQQFEWNPITDDMMVFNFLVNLPIDTIASLLPEWTKLIAKGLTKSQLVTDVIDQDVFNMLSKHYRSFKKVLENWDKAKAELDKLTKATDIQQFDRTAIEAANQAKKRWQEKYYMAQSLIDRSWKSSGKTVNLADSWLDEGLVNFIREVQKDSQDVYERLATFGWSLDDYLQEMELRLSWATRKNLSLEKQAELYVKSLEDKSRLLIARANNAQVYWTINYLYNKLNTVENWRELLDLALDKVFPEWSALKDLFREIIFKSEDTWTYAEILKRANEEWNQMWFDEIAKKTREIMAAFMSNNKELIEVWDSPLWWIKQADWSFKNMYTGEIKAEDDLIKDLWTEIASTEAVADWYQYQLLWTLNNIVKWNKDAYIVEWWELRKITSEWSQEAMWKDIFYDITDDLDNMWNGFKQKFNKWDWNKLTTQDPSAVVYDDAYKSVWLRIKTKPDGTIGIFWTKDSLINLRDNILALKRITDPNEVIDTNTLNTYKFLFANNFEQEVQKWIQSINTFRAGKKWMTPMTDTEKVLYAKEHKSYLETAYRAPEVKENNAVKWTRTKKAQPEPKQEVKVQVNEEWNVKLKKQIKDTVEGKSTPMDTEQLSAKLVALNETEKVIEQSSGKTQALLWALSFADNLSKKFQSIFNWNTANVKWAEDSIKYISDTFAWIANQLTHNWLLMKDRLEIEYVINNLTEALWTLMVMPRTISLMEDWWEELMYGLIWSVFLKWSWETQASGILFHKINWIINRMLEEGYDKLEVRQAWHQIYQFKKALQNIHENSNVEFSKKFRDGIITQLTPYFKALSWWDYKAWDKLIKRLPALEEKAISPERLKEIVHSWVPEWKVTFGNLLDGKVLINVEKLSDDEIDNIAKAMALSQMSVSGIKSEKLYNTMYSSTKRGLEHLRETMTGWDGVPVTFDINKVGNRYSVEWECINFWLLSDAQMLWSLDDMMLFENTIFHEYWHSVIHSGDKWGKWLFADYIAKLKETLRNTQLTAKTNKSTQLTLSNYFSKYNWDWYLWQIIELYNKDGLIEKLVKEFEDWNANNLLNVRWLGNLMWENEWIMTTNIEKERMKFVPIIEELVNELNTFAILGKLDTEWLADLWAVSKLNEALDVLYKASDVIDTFRHTIVTNPNISADELKKTLWTVFDPYSINVARNEADEVATQLLEWIQKATDNPQEAVKQLANLVNKIKIENKPKNVSALRKELTSKLSLIENSKAMQEKYWLTPELAREFKWMLDWFKWKKWDEQLKIILNDLNVENSVPVDNKIRIEPSHVREVYFLDIGETNLDIQYDDMLGISAGDAGIWYITPVLRKHHKAQWEIKEWAKASGEISPEITGRLSSQTYLRTIAGNEMDEMLKQDLDQAVPLIRSLSTMGEDLWSFWTDALWMLTKLVWDINKSIDKNKLLVWDETIKAYQKYVEKWWTGSFGNFVVNKLFANVLWEMWMYDETTVAMINNSLRNAQLDAVKASISWPYNRWKNKFFVQIFDNLKKDYYIERWVKWTELRNVDAASIYWIEPMLTRKQRNEAKEEWKSGKWPETIWRYYSFGRGKVNYTIDWVEKEVDLNTYKWYTEYYNDREIPMTYWEWERADIDANEVLAWASESRVYAFNEAICKYIDAIKNWEWVDDAMEIVDWAFMNIINDAWTAAHSNFRFMSYNWIADGNTIIKPNIAGGIKVLNELPSNKAKNYVKKYLESFNEKPVGNKKPNNWVELMLSLAKNLLDTKSVKTELSEESALLKIAQQLTDRKWNLNDFAEDLQTLIEKINITLWWRKERWMSTNEADDMIEGFWKEFANKWNNKIANELQWSEKNVRYDKAEEKSLDTLEFIKSLSNEKKWSTMDEDMASIDNIIKEEDSDISDIEALADNSNWDIDEVDNVEFWRNLWEDQWELNNLFGGDVEWTMELWDASQSLKDKIEQNLINAVDNDMINYSIVRDSNTYQITEKWLGKWKDLTVNLWVMYNSLKDTSKIDDHIVQAIDIWNAKDINKLSKSQKAERKDALNIFGKLSSYWNWSFINWNLVKTMSMYWVDQVFGKSIAGKNVWYVQVVLKDWANIMFSPKWDKKASFLLWDNIRDNWKTLVRFSSSSDWLSFTRSLYNSLIWEWWWVEVRFLDNDWEQLSFQSVTANDVWKWFIGEEISEYLWLWNAYKAKLNMLNSDIVYKQVWLKWGTKNKTNYNDIVKIIQNIGWDTVWVKNEDMMQFIYQSLKWDLDNVWTSNWLSTRELEKVPEKYAEKEKRLRSILWDMRRRMEDAGYVVDNNSESMVQKIVSLEIDAMPNFYNKDWTPYKWWALLEWGIEASRDKYIKVIKETPEGIKTTEYVPGRVKKINANWEWEWVNLRSYSVKVDSEWKEIEWTKEYLTNKYRVIWVKPKIDVYDITDAVNRNLSIAESKWEVALTVEDNIPDGTRVKSYFYNWKKTGWYIPIDNTTNIDSEAFRDIVDNKMLESEMETSTIWLTSKVNKDDWEMIIVLANDEWQETEAMIKQVYYYNTENWERYIWYKLFFNNDSPLGYWLADSEDAYNFYKVQKYWKPKTKKEIIEWVLNPEEKQRFIEEVNEKVNSEIKKRIAEKWNTKWKFWEYELKKTLQNMKVKDMAKKEKENLVKELTDNRVRITWINQLEWTSLYRINAEWRNVWVYNWKLVDIIPWSKEAKEVINNTNNFIDEQEITKLRNKQWNNIKLEKDDFKDLISTIEVAEEWRIKWWTKWLPSSKISNEDLIKDSSFLDWDDLIMYENVMPLQYSKWAKLAEARWKFDTSDITDEELKKKIEKVWWQWSQWWKWNKDVVSLQYENWKPIWKRWQLVEDYDAWKAEKEEADKLVNNITEAQAKGLNPNNPESTIKPTEELLSLWDIIDGEVRQNQASRSVYDLMVEDPNVDRDVKKLIKDEYDLKKVGKDVKSIAYTDTIWQIYSSSNWIQDVFNFSNFDILWWNNTLSQLRWANAEFKRVYWDRLVQAWQRWNKAFGNLTDQQQKDLIKLIHSKVNSAITNWGYKIDKVFAEPLNEAQEIVNEVAKIFSDANWNNVYILNKISNADSLDNMIYKTFNTYQNVSMWMFSNLKDTNDVREFVFNAAKSMWSKDKRAMNLAKDWVWDPLWTWPFMKFLANVRSAYRFAKYSLLSPVSGTLMYLNSAVMSEPLLWAKKSWLALYYGDNNFKKLVQEEWVTKWLERDSDLILQWANWMQMNWLAVDNAINKLAGIVWAPFWERIKKKIQAAALWWIHSIYDMQRSWAVREYAFAQALKQNWVETKEAIADLLAKVKSWEINNAEYTTRRRKIMADTEENYARFFSNANTTALSRHRWSRAFGFNFLQGYVINRADEMMQWIKKMHNFISERGFKNITWDDVTYHLAHENVELKAFLNNILLTTKLWYYLDRIDDYDGSPAKNMMGYFVDANDYLSSLDTIWFMRLFKTIPNGTIDYLEYSDYAKKDPTLGWAISNIWYELTAEICSQFFREGKFLNAMMQTIVAGMKTGDLDFAATVAWTEWEKMSNGLWRFWLVDWLEKYWLEDFSEPSDIIWSILFSTNKTTTSGKIQDKLWALSNTDKVINDPSYAAVTAIGYLPLIWELIKSATDNWGFNFSEAKYREMMHMVETDPGLKELYKGKLNTDVYSDEAITRIWSDFTSFNYPAKYEKQPGIHAVWSYIEWKDTTLNSMKEDVFVQNICEKMGITVEELHNMIASDSAKTTGRLKVMAAAEAAEPGSWKIVLSYMMANRLYELEKQYTGKQYPTAADVWDEAMNQLKRIVLEEMWEWMFTADKVSWYKAIREYISEVNPSVFKTLYKNETLNSYVWSIWFMDSLMYDAAYKWDVDAKYIKNARSVLTKYMKDTDARTSAVEYLFSQASNLNIPASGRHMVMEWILAGNIDFYNTLKNSPVLSTIYANELRDFEERLWWVLDEVDIVDDEYKKQGKKKWYTPYTSRYWDNNKKVEDDLQDKANRYFPKSSWNWNYPWNYIPKRYSNNWITPTDALDWYRRYYEGLIKTYSDRLVKSTWKKYPAQWTENITFKTGSNNRWNIKWQQLTFPEHKHKDYRTNVFSNLPGSHW